MEEHERTKGLQEVNAEILLKLGVKLRVGDRVDFNGYDATVINILAREVAPKIEDLFVTLGTEFTTANIPLTSLDSKYYI